jgi:hypothetical protein
MALLLCFHSWRSIVSYILGYEEVGSVVEEDYLLDESKATRRRKISGGDDGLSK